MESGKISAMDRQTQITSLIQQVSDGDAGASQELLPLVYEELRVLAEARLRRTPPGQTLQPTALVHEAYMRIVGATDPGWNGRGHFFFAAARAMHDILVENARRKAALKRGGDRQRIDAPNLADALAAPAEDMLALAESLQRLEAEFPRKHRVVMLRFFGGMNQDEIALSLDISERTVRQDWQFARSWLHQRLTVAERE
ncbi:MAG TPA: sigma-70 family RNA polymerase sigma factor [Phycisphaerae bacterium]|nr:sigma-70 family RNA polymerase sigma factor [Phycisphaerae bacterium]HRW53083.1 sigma-70 family RNA polymerase sigma factor [Phycisphaerae bacterium]